jgi:hypothetical protein
MFGAGVEDQVESGTRLNREGVASRGYKIKYCSGINTNNSRIHTGKISIHWTAIGGMGRR